uniref:CDP-diacylglycerol--glycerol-3-phosphate 3-phosphatidyltransferase n=1 Tax=Blastobotrys adeninivorans TaxID=409370 RepID=A0A060SYJ2_BLAAD
MFRRLAWRTLSSRRVHRFSTPLTRSWSSASFHPHFNSTLAQVDLIAPKFPLKKGEIDVLFAPDEFYDTLKQKILSAKSRVFLSALYIGKNQTELVECIDQALSKNPDLNVYILTDALRGTREAPNPCSASLLVSLVEKHGSRRVQLCMYHTPNLHGVRKLAIPNRFNEGWGLQHMKLYGFDDEIILSGANLSTDYFTNRQDRYMLFKSPELTEYYFRLQRAIARISFEVVPSQKSGFALRWPHIYTVPDPTVDPEGFMKAATRIVKPMLGPANSEKIIEEVKILKQRQSKEKEEVKDVDMKDIVTFVYPISQFTPLLTPHDASTEMPTLQRIFSMLGTHSFNWTLTAGYFNIHSDFRDKLLKSKPSTAATVITAAPEANGFFKSAGVSGLLPQVYSQLARNFLQSVLNARAPINLYEWRRGTVNTPNGWSYHAKGLWVSDSKTPESPFLTVVGSSNYTRRAYSHDLESNALVVTEDAELKRKLGAEVDNIKQHCTKMSLADYDREDRKPDWRQRLFIKTMGEKL